MLAMRLHAPAPIATAPLRADDIPVPEPGPNDVRVRVTACAICRTDLHVIEGDLPFPGGPVVPGHQVVGVIEAMGAEVRDRRIGERIGIAWLRGTCGEGHRALARARGAAHVCGPGEPFPAPPEAAIVFAPAGEVVPLALEALAPGGTVALAGIHMSAIPSLDYDRHLFREKTLRSVT